MASRKRFARALTRRIVAIGAGCGSLVVGATSASALEVSLQGAEPIFVDQPATYRATVEDAVGDVTYRWTVSDCVSTATMECPPPVESDSPEFTHQYTEVGHFNVSVLARDEAGNAGASLIQTVHLPPTEVAPAHSATLLYDPERNKLWNVNQDNGTVTRTDAEGMVAEFQAPVGERPRTLAQAPDGSIWVANQLSDTISILAPDSGHEIGRIEVPYASQPHAVAFDPSTGLAYVSLFALGRLVEVDPVSQEVTRELTLGPTPAGIAISHDGRIFVTRFISPDDHGEIWEVSADTFELARTIELPFDEGHPEQSDPDDEVGGRGVPNYVFSMVISPDGTQAWVMAKKDNIARGPKRDGRDMSAETFVRAILCVIDLETSTERVERRIDIDNRGLPIAAVFSPAGDYVYVLAQANNWLGVYDAYVSSAHLGGIQDIGAAPDGLVFLPDRRIAINAFLGRGLWIYDATSSHDQGDHQFTAPLTTIATAAEPLDEPIARGKRIFFNAADPRMSDDGYMSCTVCHYGGFHDGRVWDFSNRGEGLRNTKNLMGIRGTGHGRLHWSANFDEIQDFERDIRESLGGSGFMPNDTWTAIYEDDPFGPPAAGVDEDLDALATFIGSLEKVDRSPFRNPDGSLTADAVEGKKIFALAGCGSCHTGTDYTDSATGALHDVGTLLPTSGERLHGELTGIDTPTLLGLWQTAPYLHDGRAATLKEIFTKYNPDNQIGATSNLSDKELDQLVAYLLQIDGRPEDEPTAPEPSSAGKGSTCAVRSPITGAGGAGGAVWIVALAAAGRAARRGRLLRLVRNTYQPSSSRWHERNLGLPSDADEFPDAHS